MNVHWEIHPVILKLRALIPCGHTPVLVKQDLQETEHFAKVCSLPYTEHIA